MKHVDVLTMYTIVIKASLFIRLFIMSFEAT